MTSIAGVGHLVDRFVMPIAFTIQGMGCGSQNQSGIIGDPALPVALIAGGFTVRAAQEIYAVTVLAVSFGPERGSPVRDPIFIDGMTANAADSLVLNAAGCENEAKPD